MNEKRSSYEIAVSSWRDKIKGVDSDSREPLISDDTLEMARLILQAVSMSEHDYLHDAIVEEQTCRMEPTCIVCGEKSITHMDEDGRELCEIHGREEDAPRIVVRTGSRTLVEKGQRK